MGLQGTEAEQAHSFSSLLFFRNSGYFSQVLGGRFLNDSHLTLTLNSHTVSTSIPLSSVILSLMQRRKVQSGKEHLIGS